MSKPVTVTIPHELGQAEARRRIEEGVARAAQQFGDGVKLTKAWEGDRLSFTAKVVGHHEQTGFEGFDGQRASRKGVFHQGGGHAGKQATAFASRFTFRSECDGLFSPGAGYSSGVAQAACSLWPALGVNGAFDKVTALEMVFGCRLQ